MRQLLALDPDSGAILRYSLDMGSSEARSAEGRLIQLTEYDWSSMFSVAETTGDIIVTGKDMELLHCIQPVFSFLPSTHRQRQLWHAIITFFVCCYLLNNARSVFCSDH